MDSDWNNVMLYCDNLMNKQGDNGTYALFPDYAGLFDEANEYNEEIIMDRSYVPNLITWGEMVDMIPLSRGGRAVNRVPQQSLVDTYLMLSGKTISEPKQIITLLILTTTVTHVSPLLSFMMAMTGVAMWTMAVKT